MRVRFCLQGQVLSLASAGEFLFSGGHDGTIAVWKFDPTTQTFVSAVLLPPLDDYAFK